MHLLNHNDLPEGVTLRWLVPRDAADIIDLWTVEDALRLSSADNIADLEAYIEHNPELSIGACHGPDLMATVLAGHDGRRGYPKHIFVHPRFRKTEVALVIMRESIRALATKGIFVSHYSVSKLNGRAFAFFEKCFIEPEFTVREITESRRFELTWSKVD